ncbi:MAG: EAL domain-containing response regulator [Gallionella sp.]|jgi:EAL domain-containing protein (putative c-di-GMP-specific phosphodiesterase class I)
MILVVDDDEFQRDLIGMQLASLDFDDVYLASSGEEALAQLDIDQSNINAMIIDLSMPGMDGTVLMRHLAQRGFGAGIILLSGVQDEILSSAAGLASAHGLSILGVLNKPSSPDRLYELLAGLRAPVVIADTADVAAFLSPERLKAALTDGEFIPWYQPKVDIRSGKPVGVEALARWPVEPGVMISPANFIPAIEAAGLSDELFFAMAHQVAADLVVWRGKGIHITTAINMSMDTAHNLLMPERLSELVCAAGLQPSDLVIEITESRLMVERSLVLETLTRLSLMGFVLSIDDFGTGYSSLVQLTDLPFRELKIDGSFVQRADTERKAQAIVRISIMIGVHLEMDVIAEGVETAGQLEFLRSCGGTIIQGYHIARPMPFAACTQWLKMSSQSQTHLHAG